MEHLNDLDTTNSKNSSELDSQMQQQLEQMQRRRSASGPASSNMPIQCLDHPNNKVSALCEQCNTLVCHECSMSGGAHRSHRTCSPSEALAAVNDTYDRTVADLDVKIPEVTAKVQELDEIVEALGERRQDMDELITSEFNTLIDSLRERMQQIEARRDTLLSQVHTALEGDMRAMQQQREALAVAADLLSVARASIGPTRLDRDADDAARLWQSRSAMVTRLQSLIQLTDVDADVDALSTTSATTKNIAMTTTTDLVFVRPTPAALLTMDVNLLGVLRMVRLDGSVPDGSPAADALRLAIVAASGGGVVAATDSNPSNTASAENLVASASNKRTTKRFHSSSGPFPASSLTSPGTMRPSPLASSSSPSISPTDEADSQASSAASTAYSTPRTSGSGATLSKRMSRASDNGMTIDIPQNRPSRVNSVGGNSQHDPFYSSRSSDEQQQQHALHQRKRSGNNAGVGAGSASPGAYLAATSAPSPLTIAMHGRPGSGGSSSSVAAAAPAALNTNLEQFVPTSPIRSARGGGSNAETPRDSDGPINGVVLGRLASTPSSTARDHRLITRPARLVGIKGSENGQFKYPVGVAVDAAGLRLVVGEYTNKRLQILRVNGDHIRTINVGQNVYAVTITPTGDVWAALHSANCVRQYNGVTGALMQSVSCFTPWGLDVLADGSLAVGCGFAKKVEMYDASGQKRWTSTGNGFNLAGGVLAIENELYVCDYGNNRVQVLSIRSGRYLRSIGQGGLMNGPLSIALDPAAQLLVVGENDKISVWSIDGNERICGWGTQGSQPGEFSTVEGVAVGPDGAIYAADHGNSRIQVF